MSRLMTLVAALTAIFVLSLAGPADAAQRKADGIQKQQAGQYEVSDQRRYYRRYYRPYYRPYYAPYYGYRPYPYYYGGYPAYGYGYPYGYARPYYGSPGFGFSFRF